MTNQNIWEGCLDIYQMNVREVLEKSKYEFYLQDTNPAPGASG